MGPTMCRFCASYLTEAAVRSLRMHAQRRAEGNGLEPLAAAPAGDECARACASVLYVRASRMRRGMWGGCAVFMCECAAGGRGGGGVLTASHLQFACYGGRPGSLHRCTARSRASAHTLSPSHCCHHPTAAALRETALTSFPCRTLLEPLLCEWGAESVRVRRTPCQAQGKGVCQPQLYEPALEPDRARAAALDSGGCGRTDRGCRRSTWDCRVRTAPWG